MKEPLIKIKNNLQGINSRVEEDENQISDLEYKKAKNIQLEQQEEKRIQKRVQCKEPLGQLQMYKHSHCRGAGRRKERARNWKPI